MADRFEVMEKLKEFLAEDTDVKIDTFDESLSLREGLGLDSVDLVGIIMRIEGLYHIRLTHIELQNVATVKDLLDLITMKIDTPVGAESLPDTVSLPPSSQAA